MGNDDRGTTKRSLIEDNLAFAFRVASEYRGRGLPTQDLIGAACLGLVEAAKRFDPEREVRFVSYAAWWIRKEILEAMARETRVVRIPRTRYRRMRAESTGRVAPAEVRLDADPYGESGPERVLPECVDRSTPETRALRDEIRRVLLDEIERLDPRARTVLRRRFGLDGSPRGTLETIGEGLGVSREWVRRIESRAIATLRLRVSHRLGRQGRDGSRGGRRRAAATIAPIM